MQDLYRQELNDECVPIRRGSLAYGDEFLIDTSPSDQPYLGAWEQALKSQQSLSKHRLMYSSCNIPAVKTASQTVLLTDWSAGKTPITQVGLLDSEEEQLQELIWQLKISLSIPYSESLAIRLVTLFQEAREEDSISLGISVGSLRNFLNFLKLNINLNYPTISLTPEYNIYSTWRREKNRLFSVHFLPNGDARFVIFKPNDRHPERQIRISGMTTTDILTETVAPYGIWD
jgi:hypothetical protein